MTRPMVDSVRPKPVVIELITSAGIMPPIRPDTDAAMTSAMIAWTLVFTTRKISRKMAKPSPAISWNSIPGSAMGYSSTAPGLGASS